MKLTLKIFKNLIFIILSTLFLFSCKRTIGLEIETIKDNVDSNVSKVASEPEFLNKLHLIRNPMTNTTMLVKGDGTVVLKTMEPSVEQIGTIEDIDKNTTNYIFKTYNGEDIETKTYGEGEMKYESTDLTMRTVFYDKNGNEVGLTTNNYGANYTTKDKIIYRDNSLPYGSNDLRMFDVNTKEITELPYRNIYTFDGNFLLSTDEFGDDKEESEVTIVYDENFNELNRVKGYSLNGVENGKDASVVYLSKRVRDENYNDGIDRKYNFLDEKHNLIFDEDLDAIIWGNVFPVLTLRRGEIVFDYDFIKKEKVSEDRPYVEVKSNWEKLLEEQGQYEDLRLKLEEDKKYQYVNVFSHGENVLFFAYENMNVGMFDDNTCDVYNDKLELVASFNSIDNIFNEQGYIFVNKDTVYNDKLEIIKKFDTKCLVEIVEKFDKVFFSNGTDYKYSNRKNFELYDENFNVVFEHIDSLDSYAYDDYIVMTKDNNTYFVDKNMNISKKINNRSISVRGWYSDIVSYRPFVDLETERMGIIDNELQFVVDNMKDISDLKEKYFTYQNGFKYGLMDYEGKPILTYSIFDTMREDSAEKDFKGNYVIEY